MATLAKESLPGRPSTLKSYVDRFRKGDPRSREERRADAKGAETRLIGREDFWWMNTGDVAGHETKTVAEKPYHVTNGGERWSASAAENNGLCVTLEKAESKDAAKIVEAGREQSSPLVSFQMPTFLSSSPQVRPPTSDASQHHFPSTSPIPPQQTSQQQRRHQTIPPDRTEEQQLDDIVTRKLMYQRQQQRRHPDDAIGHIPAPIRDSVVSSSGVGVISSRGLGSEGTDSPEEGVGFGNASVGVVDRGRPSSPPAQLLLARVSGDDGRPLGGDDDALPVGAAGVPRLAQRMARAKQTGEASRILRPANPEDDILYQWRLRRKLQEAREGIGKRAEFVDKMERDLKSARNVRPGDGTEREASREEDNLRRWRTEREKMGGTRTSNDDATGAHPSPQPRRETIDVSTRSDADDGLSPSVTKLMDVATSPRTESSTERVTSRRVIHDAATSPMTPSSPFHDASTAPFPYPYWMPGLCLPPFAPANYPFPMQSFVPSNQGNPFHPDLNHTNVIPQFPGSLNYNNGNRTNVIPQVPGSLNYNNNNSSSSVATPQVPRSLNYNNNNNDGVNNGNGEINSTKGQASNDTDENTFSVANAGNDGPGLNSNEKTKGSQISEKSRPSTESVERSQNHEEEGGFSGRSNSVSDHRDESERNSPRHSVSADALSARERSIDRRISSSRNFNVAREPSPLEDVSLSEVTDVNTGTEENGDDDDRRVLPASESTGDHASVQRTIPMMMMGAGASQPDLTVVSSLSSFSSREDVSSIVDLEEEADEKEGESEVFVAAVDEEEIDRERRVGDPRGRVGEEQRQNVRNRSACSRDRGRDDDDGEIELYQNRKSRPSRCEDFESDESEFEDDDILIVLRKKRKELIQKLWMIDEFINRKK